MDKILTLDSNFLEKVISLKKSEKYQRAIEGNYELINYAPNSTVKIWFNSETESYSEHWHPATEIIMPLSNKYTVITSCGETILNVGDILIIPGGEIHQLVTPESGYRLIYLFDFSVLSKIPGASYITPFLSQPMHITSENASMVYDKLSQSLINICLEYFSNNILKELTIYSSLLQFYIDYGEYLIKSGNDSVFSKAGNSKKLMDKINSALNYIDEHYTENITLETVAEISGFSKYHFSRIFKHYSGAGCNFNDYLSFHRIKCAVTLLANHDISITEIALQSGFVSLSTFNRVFKRFKFCTPSEYRSLYYENEAVSK